MGVLCPSCSDDETYVPTGGFPGPGPNEVLVAAGDGAAYYIDRYEVTRKAYAAWLSTHPYTGIQPAGCSDNDDFTPTCRWPAAADEEDHPVVCVDWCDAYAYCQVFGQRLCGQIGGGANDYHTYSDPDLDQWYNACSAGGVDEYPYGSPYDPHTCNGGLHGRGTTAPVGSLPGCRSATGLLDMSGNIREWKDACENDPTNTVAFNYCRLGGGSFRDGELRHLTCESPGQDAFRAGHWDSIGFRCCRD
ncbi:MAG: SUMF1/EgtB/PvdO family nonheme iron enzyme, partial [Deltaproteobacteria bacterium]|nr:SUMF1/EgtB/PvdO family nonheme iron enzyme [Deltaproteobacteria bacterium]